jgi:hypothetical protein
LIASLCLKITRCYPDVWHLTSAKQLLVEHGLDYTRLKIVEYLGRGTVEFFKAEYTRINASGYSPSAKGGSHQLLQQCVNV